MMKSAVLIVQTLLVSLVLGSVAAARPADAVTVGQACDGAVAVCDKGLWCEPPAGTCSLTRGVCVAVPRLCIARKNSASYKPVCGCNSKTYSSDCFRRAYKIGKSRDGKC
jgi:hypothetical protein